MANAFECNNYFASNDFTHLLSNSNVTNTDFKISLLTQKTLFIKFDPAIYSQEGAYAFELIKRLVKQEGVTDLAINLEDATWLDSSTISTLVNLRKLFSGTCCVYNLDPIMIDIFKTLKLDLILKITDNQEDAFKYLEENSLSRIAV